MGRIVRREIRKRGFFRLARPTAISWLQRVCARLVNRLGRCDQIAGTPDSRFEDRRGPRIAVGPV